MPWAAARHTHRDSSGAMAASGRTVLRSGYVIYLPDRLLTGKQGHPGEGDLFMDCFLCGNKGSILYEGIRDQLYGTPGEWNFSRCTNSKCDLIWLEPIPAGHDLSKAYEKYYTHLDPAHPDAPGPSASFTQRVRKRIKRGYAANRFDDPLKRKFAFDRLMARLVAAWPTSNADLEFGVFYLSPMRKGRLLDVGCGAGRMLKALGDLGWLTEGVDFDPAAVECAKAQGLKAHAGSLQNLEYPDDTFDAVILNHSIEHIPEPFKLLRECNRIMKRDGKLVIVTPNARSWGHRLYAAAWRGLEPPRHLYIYSRNAISKLVKMAGFEVSECRTVARHRGIFLDSLELRQNRSPLERKRPTVQRKLWAEIMCLVEWLRLKFDAEAGEEIVLVATKQSRKGSWHKKTAGQPGKEGNTHTHGGIE